VVLLFALSIDQGFALKRTRWYQLDESYSFERYVQEFSKTYASPSERETSRAIFEDRLADVLAHNKDPSFSWKKGVNRFSDRTDAEFRRLLGYNKALAFSNSESRKIKAQHVVFNGDLPENVDWRNKGIISPVKDQGDCGSCWTFGTCETIESYLALANGELNILSEQQILDCTPNPNDCGGTGGCSGGTPEIAYQQIITTGGLSDEWTYPYLSYHGQNFPSCRFNSTMTPAVAVLSGYQELPSNQYQPVVNALANIGPLVVNVDASAWGAYDGGVFNGCNQTNPDIDHVVQLVGYGTDLKLGEYWLIRNSWSPSWGEDGYIRLARSSSPTCGVDLWPQDGTGCNGGPPTVRVCGECAILYDVSYPTIKGS